MTKTTVYVLVGCAVLILGGVRTLLTDQSKNPSGSGNGVRLGAEGADQIAKEASLLSAGGSRLEANVAPDPVTAEVTTGPAPIEESGNQSSAVLEQGTATDALVAALPAEGKQDLNSVIGRPFPMSASVSTSCKRLTGGLCEEFLRPLSAFAEEPRDAVWAPSAEEKLRRYVEAGPSDISLRSVECRQSLCVIEVAAIPGRPYFGLDGDEEKSFGLDKVNAMHGYEVAPSTDRITITLLIYQRVLH